MKRSLYYTEGKEKSSNAITSIGLTIVIIAIGLFLLYQGVMAIPSGQEMQLTDRAESLIINNGGSYSTVHFEKRVQEIPKEINGIVCVFKVTNFRDNWMSPIRDQAYIKCEIDLTKSHSYDDRLIGYSSTLLD